MAVADALDAHDLAAAARDLLRIDDPRTARLWSRGCALLARQSIEAAMEQLWDLRCPAMRGMTARCQLLCLGDFLHDAELAGRVSVSWHALSRVCHVRIYELPPSLEELQSCLDCAWQLADAVGAARSARRTPRP